MTTRDPRDPRSARVGRNEAAQARDPTAPLSIDIDPRDHPSLATGTGDERTKVESPNARQPKPERAATRPPPIPRNSDDPDNRLGATLGTYRLVELLGKGGMGYVYRAEHVKLGREVALKLLRADYARRRESVNRFFQEAKTVNRVRHRNIVDVTDFVELPDGTTFIIMELLQGQSLGKWARTGIDLPRALAVLVQICDGLGAAHAVGVIHRDLKPDNVVVTATADGGELAKLLDFGVAKLINRDEQEDDVGFQTQAGSVIGTPAYMSPEQAGGMAIDQRSDIYSLGAIMYELFCGQPLFRGRSFGEYVRKHLTEAPIPPRQTEGGANMHERLEALILRCLEKEPDRRFGHILELRDGILQLLGEPYAHPSGARPV
ncbi:MAG TPA: serine/threonine-protein kinase, partial [Kofleriaceae bacterium]